MPICARCEQFSNSTEPEEMASVEAEYRKHITRKDLARAEKEADKMLAKKDNSWHAVTMDLHSVLTTPCGRV